MSVVVRVLGPLEVVCEGNPVVIHGSKERALLVTLAVHAGRVVSTDRLVKALWDGEPPASAEASLRVLVSRVRKMLAAAGTAHVIGTCSPGYLLAVDAVDAVQFEALSVRGRAELADERPTKATSTLTEALALWRGDRLAETGTAQLQAEADRFEEARLIALEARIDADLACGRHRDVLGELSFLCHSHPLREHFWAQWVTALYRCDRQADALTAYQDLRRTLSDQLGIDPSPVLQALEAAVLTQSLTLAAPAPLARLDGVSAKVPSDEPETVALVGRDDELEALAWAWAAACDGTSHTALVSGEAGIGKSRLLREAAHRARQEGAIVLWGSCDEELAVPYQPFVDCMSYASGLVDVDPRQLAELARMTPALADGGADPAPLAGSPEVERHRLFTAVGAVLTALADRAPVLLILDDLHWADQATLQLLRHLAGLRLGRVLIVGAHRESQQLEGPLVELLGALRRDVGVIRIPMSGVAQQHAVAIMEATAGQEPDEAGAELASLLHRETGGNPFYLTEMLRHLLETGVITEAPDGRCTAGDITAAGLPDSIREVVRARLSRLGIDAIRSLSTAAVIGQEFDLDLLASTTGLEDDDLLDVLESAVRAALISQLPNQAGRFRFAHSLVQHTLYEDVGLTRRARVHARVAAAMDSLGGREPGELAYHYLAGLTPANAERALHHARAAAERALAMSAPEEAVRWYGAVLDALPAHPTGTEQTRALIDLGIAQRQAGHAAHRETLFAAAAAARACGADDLLVAAALASYRGGFSSLGRVDSEKVALLESALALTPSDTGDRARLLATLAGELAWHPDHHRRIALADEALAVARRCGDPDALLYAILRPVPADWVPERSEHRVQVYGEAVALADRLGDPMTRFSAAHVLAQTLMERAHPDRLERELAEAADLATEIREPFMRWVNLLVRSGLAVLGGDLPRAEAQADEALRIGLVGGLPDAQMGHDQLLGLIRWHQGRLAEVLPQVRTAAAEQPRDAIRWAGLALAEAVAGDRDWSKRMLREVAEDHFDLFYGASWLGSLCQWAVVAADLGDADAAVVLYEKLKPWKHLFGISGPLPAHGVSHCLARLAVLLGDNDSAEGHFADAWRTHRRMRAPFYIAETGLYWGRHLVNGAPERAGKLVNSALSLARRYGFGDVERRAELTLSGASHGGQRGEKLQHQR